MLETLFLRFFSECEHHLLGYVGTGDVALPADRPCRRQRDQPGAARNIEDPLASSKLGHLQQARLRRLELACPESIVVSNGLVPAVALNAPLKSGIHDGYLLSGVNSRTSRWMSCGYLKT